MNFHSIHISPLDVLDIAVVALFIYIGLVWFKRTRAFLVVVGIVILGSVYAIARFLNLFLTTAVLQGFFAVLLIAIIVIFQEEIRHFFERIALWGLGKKYKTEAAPLISILARTAADLARAKTGALVVISGRDPVWRHIEGGTEVDGRPSEALLKSIFDSSSPGHDGAVIIENGRVARFAAYLPLSKDLTKLSGKGTRHAAALGLSERCDALCLVFSEERGEISIARDGDLKTIAYDAQIGEVIDGYMNEKFPRRQARNLANIVRHNLWEKIIAILLALGLWLAFVHKEKITQIPHNFSIERAVPPEVSK